VRCRRGTGKCTGAAIKHQDLMASSKHQDLRAIDLGADHSRDDRLLQTALQIKRPVGNPAIDHDLSVTLGGWQALVQ